jgi:hypothetical protein
VGGSKSGQKGPYRSNALVRCAGKVNFQRSVALVFHALTPSTPDEGLDGSREMESSVC